MASLEKLLRGFAAILQPGKLVSQYYLFGHNDIFPNFRDVPKTHTKSCN